MPNTFTNGKRAIAECDRCGFRFKLNQLRTLVIKTKNVNLKVCESCWEPDHPQLQLGMYPVADPQALLDPRPDRVEYAQMRAAIQPVYSYLSGSARTFATGAVGTVGIETPVAVAVTGVPSVFYLGSVSVDTPVIGPLHWISLYGDFGANVSSDYSTSVAYDSSGNIYSVGADGNQGIPFLVKYSPVGQILWQVDFNEVNNRYKTGDAVAVDNSDNVYVSVGMDDAITNFTLIKLSASGTILWQITFNDAGVEAGTGIAVDSDNNVYVTGMVPYTAPYPVFLIKVDSSGAVQWQKKLAGANFNQSHGIAIDSANNIYLNTYNWDGSLASSVPYLIKYNSSGVLQWQRQFTDGVGTSLGMVATDASNYIYTTNAYAGNSGFNIIKWDPSGSIVWQKVLNPTLGYPVGIKTDSFGHIYVAASVDGGPWNLAIYKFDNTGAQLWQRKLSSVDGIDTYYYWTAQNLAVYADKFVVSGHTLTPSLPNYEAMAAQLPTDGSKLGTWGDFTYSVGTQAITNGSWVASPGALVESVATFSTSTNLYTVSVATGTNTLTAL